MRTERAAKRVVRYLKSRPRCALRFLWNTAEIIEICIYTDSDWAGDKIGRRSSSGGVVQLNGMTILHGSKLQSNVALSSGEAKLNAAVKAVAEGLGMYELRQEWKLRYVSFSLCIDAIACRGILLRQGPGKMKHLCTKHIWVQEVVSARDLRVFKVPGNLNCCGIFTHPVSRNMLEAVLSNLGFVFSRPMAE